MWHLVQSMPLWADSASVFCAGFIALHEVQYDWSFMAATGQTRTPTTIAARTMTTTQANHALRYQGRGTGR